MLKIRLIGVAIFALALLGATKRNVVEDSGISDRQRKLERALEVYEPYKLQFKTKVYVALSSGKSTAEVCVDGVDVEQLRIALAYKGFLIEEAKRDAKRCRNEEVLMTISWK